MPVPAARLRVVALLTLPALGLSTGAFAQGSPSPQPVFLKPGEKVPAFETQSADGKPVHVDFSKGSSTLLLFFLSGCPSCHKMIPLWNEAYARRGPRLDVIGVIMDREPPGFFATMGIQFPVVRSTGRAFSETFKVQRVPITLRVKPSGQVEDIGVGTLDPIRLGELFRN